MKNLFLGFLLLFGLNLSNANCVDIDTPEIQPRLNVTYDADCFNQVKTQYECCSHFMLDDRCVDNYKECVNYKDYILNGIKSSCDVHNQTHLNLSYSDKCHDFTLSLEPYCCDNMSLPECSNWYTDCHLHEHGESDNTNCSLPTKYRNDHCVDFVKHIDSDCCDNFNDKCGAIYNWCVENDPNETSVLDLFLGPRLGHIMGDSHKVYNDIGMLELCAALCVSTKTCHSINYMEDFRQCHLSNHVIGDSDVDFLEDTNSVYYSKIYTMPVTNSLCNIRYDNWIGDGYCDDDGGYNTHECNYDGGDCCKETCVGIGCLWRDLNCKDPSVLNPTLTTTESTTNTLTTTSKTTTSKTTTSKTTTNTLTTTTKTTTSKTTTTKTTTTTTQECHNGKVFSTCGSPCDATCQNPNPQCIQVCATGCFCPKDKPIFDRIGNRCITECTTTSTTGTSNTGTSTTGTSTTGISNSSIVERQAISSSGNKDNKTQNILLGIFIPLVVVGLLVGGFILKRHFTKETLVQDGNTVIMNAVPPSFENPVYNGPGSELYTETSQYNNVNNRYILDNNKNTNYSEASSNI